MSLPSPGAWIETILSVGCLFPFGRSLHRERGLKLSVVPRDDKNLVAPFTGSVD